MKKTKIILATLLLASLFAGCNKKAEADGNSGAETKAEKAAKNVKPNPESDFKFSPSKDVTRVEITAYIGKSKKVVIPETIQGLPVKSVYMSNLSSNLENVTLVVFPSTVKKIEVDSIGRYLKEGKYADVVLPEGLIAIKKMQDSKISYLKFPSTLKYISYEAFKGLDTKTLVLPDTLEVIGSNAFQESTVETLTLPSPSGKLFIGHQVFSECHHLSQVNVPENIEEHYRTYRMQDSSDLDFSLFMEGKKTKVVDAGHIPYPFVDWNLSPMNLRSDVFYGCKGLNASFDVLKKLNIDIPVTHREELYEFSDHLREILKPLPQVLAESIFLSFGY